jgi:zinc/manganese transport system substrate-binding protein
MVGGRGRGALIGAVALGVTATLAAPGAVTSPGRVPDPAVINVVAAEDFWGSLAAQLGGRAVHVTSIITNPNADPHEYEASTAVARTFGGANYVILNGAGYDDWAAKILAANPEPRRVVFVVADLLGKRPGDNPHFWYDPDYVFRVIDRISSDYRSIEPADAKYFHQRLGAVEASFGSYRELLASIRRADAGVKVASTESIFQYLARALDFNLVTPYPFMQAVAEGYDPPVGAVASFEREISAHDFRLLVYNSQTVTALTTNIREQVASEHIPIVGISETLRPQSATFQQWMVSELTSISRALAGGSRRK